MQCCVEVIEGVENSFYGKPSCSFETHDAIISGLQFIFSSLQFLFIFTRGNVSEKFFQIFHLSPKHSN